MEDVTALRPPVESGLSLLSLARSLATGVLHGRHRSLARGGSAEFYDFRAYTAGDPIRLIDWRLLGRTDRAYLRRYRQESQITLVLAVDASESMRFAGLKPTSHPTKLRRACELAAALALLAARGGDRVALVMEGAAETPMIPPASGMRAARQIIERLERLLASPATRPRPSRPALISALSDARAMVRRGGVVVALTDALDELPPLLRALAALRNIPTIAGLSAARLGGDVSLVQVLTDDELALPAMGPARFVDPETGHVERADAGADRDEYREAIHAHIASLRRGVLALPGHHVLARTSTGAINALIELLGAPFSPRSRASADPATRNS